MSKEMTKPKRVMYCEVSKMRFLKYVDQLEAYVDKLELDLFSATNYANAIPYNILSDSFKKSIDSIEDNLNKPPAFNVVNSEITEESGDDFIETELGISTHDAAIRTLDILGIPKELIENKNKLGNK